MIKRFNKNVLAIRKQCPPVNIKVPDIKQYLVDEYEKVQNLKLENERLEQELEAAAEINMKYEAAMVTLDEYKKRLDLVDGKLAESRLRLSDAQTKIYNLNDRINTYKIQLHTAALTKEDIQDEIIDEFKKYLVSTIMSHKGKLSKACVCGLINTAVYIGEAGESND
jgi:chromosome segregation ATPase